MGTLATAIGSVIAGTVSTLAEVGATTAGVVGVTGLSTGAAATIGAVDAAVTLGALGAGAYYAADAVLGGDDSGASGNGSGSYVLGDSSDGTAISDYSGGDVSDGEVETHDNVGGDGSSAETAATQAHQSAAVKGTLVSQGQQVFDNNGGFGFTKTLGS